MPRELYQDMKRRNARAKELRSQGHTVRRSSHRNQLLHPQYVVDWEGAVETGLGNTMYKTPFSVLYEVAW